MKTRTRADDGVEEVVEVVLHAAGQLTCCLHPLRLPQRLSRGFQLGLVPLVLHDVAPCGVNHVACLRCCPGDLPYRTILVAIMVLGAAFRATLTHRKRPPNSLISINWGGFTHTVALGRALRDLLLDRPIYSHRRSLASCRTVTFASKTVRHW
jgi:hypothetical protein